MVVLAVERRQVVARDRLDSGPRPRPGREVRVAAHQARPLAPLDARRRVVAPLQLLQGLALGEGQPALVEPRVPEHVEEEVEAGVEVAGQAVHVGPARGRPDVAADLRGEEGGLLVEVGRAHRRRPARPHLAAGEAGEADLVRRVQVRPGADGHPHRRQRQLVVLHHEDDDAVRQLVAMVRGHRRGEVEQLVGQVRGMSGNRLRGRRRPEQQRHQGQRGRSGSPRRKTARTPAEVGGTLSRAEDHVLRAGVAQKSAGHCRPRTVA